MNLNIKPRVKVNESGYEVNLPLVGDFEGDVEDIKSLEVSKVLNMGSSGEEYCYIVYGRPSSSKEASNVISEELHLNKTSGALYVGGELRCHLLGIELRLFSKLFALRGECISRDKLYELMYEEERMPFCRRIDNLISAIRKKIELTPEQPQHLITIRNKGYLLK